MKENAHALKHLFGRELLKRLANSLGKAHPSFNQKYFLSQMSFLEKLEMKPRLWFLRDKLRELLPQDYPQAVKILREAVKAGRLEGFDLWPFTEFVQTFGLGHAEISLDALKEFTTAFTSEWAVRPFLKSHTRATLKYLEECALGENEHVRRWASEGTRPRLPWGERLHDFVQDPLPVIKILEKLKFDSALYVRKSVANNLNDISKDHPDLVLKILKRWRLSAPPEHLPKINWVIGRALRTLIKKGHPGALNLIGVSAAPKIKVTGLKFSAKNINLGERLTFTFEIKSLSLRSQKLVVDYIIHHVKSNRETAPKVFKLRCFELAPLKTTALQKSHHFKKITTREYYSGRHFIEIQINGKIFAKSGWSLTV